MREAWGMVVCRQRSSDWVRGGADGTTEVMPGPDACGFSHPSIMNMKVIWMVTVIDDSDPAIMRHFD